MNDDDVPRHGREAESESSSAGEHAPRAATPKKPPPPPPNATSRVPRPLRWLVDDAGLKLLALVLAVSTWALVRDTQLKTTDVVTDVSVEIEGTPPDVRLRPGGTRVTKLTLVGTTGSVRRARAQLEATGRRIKLRVHDLKDARGAAADPPYTDFADVDDFACGVENKQVVAKIDPPVRVYWSRVASLEVDELERPEVVTGPGYFEVANGYPTIDTPKVTVTGPLDLIERLRTHAESLRPDPVDVQGWLKLNSDLTTLCPWTTGFGRWRAADPENRSEALVTISPASVSGKLKLRESKPETLKADVALLYPPGVAPSAYDAFDVRILEPSYDVRTRKLDIVIKGEPSLVADRKSQTPGWTLAIALPPPPADGAPDLENANAFVHLVPPPGDDLMSSEAKAGVRLVGPSKVFVSITRKKP